MSDLDDAREAVIEAAITLRSGPLVDSALEMGRTLKLFEAAVRLDEGKRYEALVSAALSGMFTLADLQTLARVAALDALAPVEAP